MSKKKTVKETISGDISIHTQNIFPIIKKWLYSDRDIFLRELISNSYDAIKKRNRIAMEEKVDGAGDGKIEVLMDTKAKTITISDNGLGMDSEDIQNYINQIAFSGAEDFLSKYGDDENKQDIIGHFGMGFYSAFMVAESVEINSLSYKKEASAVHWKCDGETSFEMGPGSRKTVGTDVVLHINKESKDFLEPGKLKDLIQKYANFLPVEISLDGEPCNHQNPLWVKAPQDVKDEEYGSFYSTLFPMQAPALFHIHLNVDYPFRLQGILYFPKLSQELENRKGRVKLFCQQVFVSDNAADVLPEFLTLLQGCIDCPDFPLNVSRSALQNDPYVQKISKHIVKKVADKIVQLYKKDRTQFETYWDDIHPFVKYGMMSNDDFYEKAKDSVVFKTSEGKYVTISEYFGDTSSEGESSERQVVYSASADAQGSMISMLRAQGVEVLVLDTVIDSHFIQFLEGKDSGLKFVSVEGAAESHLVGEDSSKSKDDSSNETEPVEDEIVEIFKSALGNEKVKVSAKHLKSAEVPAMVTQEEHAKRFKEMSKMMSGAGQMGGLFDDVNLLLNLENPIIQNIKALSGDPNSSEKVALLCSQVFDLAKMAHEPLSGDAMHQFLARSSKLLVDASGS